MFWSYMLVMHLISIFTLFQHQFIIFDCRNNRIGLATEGQLMLNTTSRIRQQ